MDVPILDLKASRIKVGRCYNQSPPNPQNYCQYLRTKFLAKPNSKLAVVFINLKETYCRLFMKASPVLYCAC